jgi:hypothetical protein
MNLVDAVRKKDITLVKQLIGQGADVNMKNSSGQSPLLFAVTTKNVEIMKLLIENGVDINKKFENGNFPLDLAIYNKDIEMVKLLLKNGAKVNKSNIRLITDIEILKLFPTKIKRQDYKVYQYMYFIEYENNEYRIFITNKEINVYQQDESILRIYLEPSGILYVEIPETFSKGLFNYIMCSCICIGLKYNFLNLEQTIEYQMAPYYDFSGHEKVSDFTNYCNCEIKTQKYRTKDFCKNGKIYLNNLISQLRLLDHSNEDDKEEFGAIVHKIWLYIYYNNSKNLYFSAGNYIQLKLIEYIELLMKQKNSFLGNIEFDFLNNEIHAPDPKKLNVGQDKKILGVTINANGFKHANTVVIENNVAYRYEPSDQNMKAHDHLKIDYYLKMYLDKMGVKYSGIHQDNCSIEHYNLCAFMSMLNIIHPKITDSELGNGIINFFDWLVNKRLCGTDWKSITQRIK